MPIVYNGAWTSSVGDGTNTVTDLGYAEYTAQADNEQAIDLSDQIAAGMKIFYAAKGITPLKKDQYVFNGITRVLTLTDTALMNGETLFAFYTPDI